MRFIDNLVVHCSLIFGQAFVSVLIFDTRDFSVADPTVLNSLSDSLRDPAVESERIRRDLKTHFFA